MLVLACVGGCGGAADAPQPPEPLPGQPVVVYPIELWDAGIEGETVVMVHVTDEGTVDSAFVATSSGHAAFDSAAVRGALAMRYQPAHHRGRRADAWVRLPVRFARDTLAADDAVRTPVGEER